MKILTLEKNYGFLALCSFSLLGCSFFAYRDLYLGGFIDDGSSELTIIILRTFYLGFGVLSIFYGLFCYHNRLLSVEYSPNTDDYSIVKANNQRIECSASSTLSVAFHDKKQSYLINPDMSNQHRFWIKNTADNREFIGLVSQKCQLVGNYKDIYD